MRRTRGAKTPTRKTSDKTTNAGEGPLLVKEGDSPARFTRGPHEGKRLSEIKGGQLDALLKRSYPHASDPELLLNEYLSRLFKRPVTSGTALSAMREEWQKTQGKLDELQQNSLSVRLWGRMADGLREAAEGEPEGHGAEGHGAEGAS